MSDLQIVLIILGAFIIAGVIAYNWVQERKLRENISDDFIVPQKDVLVDEFYIDTEALVEKEFEGDAHKGEILKKLYEDDTRKEPEINDEQPYTETEEYEPVTVAETVNTELEEVQTATDNTDIDESPQSAAGDPTPEETVKAEITVEKNLVPEVLEAPIKSSLPEQIHPQVDLTAVLYSTKGIDGQKLYSMVRTVLKDIALPVMLHGLTEDANWHVIDDATKEGDMYTQAACSLQLADRRGPVPKPILNKFQYAVETIGLELNTHVEWQGKGDPAQRAVDLDKFCMDVDQLVSVHLVQGDTPMHGTKFKGLAEANGLKLKHGKFCYFDEQNPDTPKFILVNADDQPFTADSLRTHIVRGAVFQVEIPKVNNCEQVFNHMISIAQKMANSLGARMVDDNQKPLGDLQLEKIRQQLKVIHATMVARGVMPGSDSSMRLFN